jgi:hypothetical protein
MDPRRTNLRRHARRICTVATALVWLPCEAATQPGQVLCLDGAQAHLEMADVVGATASTAFTASAWFRVDKLQGWQALFWKGDQPDGYPYSNREFGLFLHGGSVHLSSTPVSRQYRGHIYLDTPRDLVQAGRWHHVAAVLTSDASGGAMRIYLDGELAASRPYDRSGIRDATGPLWIGGIPGRSADFRGLVDEAQLWHRALTGDEIRVGMNRPLRGDEPGLLAYYRFDGNGAMGIIRDHSLGGHHGRLVAGAYLRGAREPLITPYVPLAAAATPAATVTTTTTTDSGPTTTTTTTSVPLVVMPAPVPSPEPLLISVREAPPSGSIAGAEADLVIQAIGHHDQQVRREAVLLIARLQPTRRIDALRRALHSHDSVVRRHAVGLLAQFWPDADEALTLDASVGASVGASAGTTVTKPSSRRRYRGWEHKWSAEGPDFWGIEDQGLLAHYNRVEGLFLGWRQARKYQSRWGVANYGEIGRGMASGTWRWQAGGELFTYYGPPTLSSHLATVGVELHDLTDTQDGWLISQEENSLNAAVLRRDYRDHYRRTGGSLYTSHNVGGVLQVGARWSRDRFESMGQASDWALFSDGWSDPAFRLNPAVDEGAAVSLRADAQLDTRSHIGRADRGWFINAFAERSGGILGGDFQFKRYLLDLRRYQPMGPGTRLDLRLRGSTAKGDLPQQYVYRLGGFGSLRGYGFKAFAGDRSVLLNAQYWLDADHHWAGGLPLDDLGLGVFFDAGSAWFAHDRSDPFTGFQDLALGADTGPEWKRAVGLAVGTADEGLRLEFTRALDDDPGAMEPESAGWSMTARISRAF